MYLIDSLISYQVDKLNYCMCVNIRQSCLIFDSITLNGFILEWTYEIIHFQLNNDSHSKRDILNILNFEYFGVFTCNFTVIISSSLYHFLVFLK